MRVINSKLPASGIGQMPCQWIFKAALPCFANFFSPGPKKAGKRGNYFRPAAANEVKSSVGVKNKRIPRTGYLQIQIR
jgi:hypothetical protein